MKKPKVNFINQEAPEGIKFQDFAHHPSLSPKKRPTISIHGDNTITGNLISPELVSNLRSILEEDSEC